VVICSRPWHSRRQFVVPRAHHGGRYSCYSKTHDILASDKCLDYDTCLPTARDQLVFMKRHGLIIPSCTCDGLRRQERSRRFWRTSDGTKRTNQRRQRETENHVTRFRPYASCCKRDVNMCFVSRDTHGIHGERVYR
jgi:hypothetical protein